MELDTRLKRLQIQCYLDRQHLSHQVVSGCALSEPGSRHCSQLASAAQPPQQGLAVASMVTFTMSDYAKYNETITWWRDRLHPLLEPWVAYLRLVSGGGVHDLRGQGNGNTIVLVSYYVESLQDREYTRAQRAAHQFAWLCCQVVNQGLCFKD